MSKSVADEDSEAETVTSGSSDATLDVQFGECVVEEEEDIDLEMLCAEDVASRQAEVAMPHGFNGPEEN